MKYTIGTNIVKNNYYCNDMTMTHTHHGLLQYFFFNLLGIICNKFRTKSPGIKVGQKVRIYILYFMRKSQK